MFEGSIFKSLITAGGGTLILLLFCLAISVTITIERLIYLSISTKVSRATFMAEIRKLLATSSAGDARDYCAGNASAIARVAREGLGLAEMSETAIRGAMERQIAIETVIMEKYIAVLGTIGSTAVYIGLFGTVIGIIRAFADISSPGGGGGIGAIIGGISEALISTAAGILVAVPAVIAYNLIMKRVDNAVLEMELCASELADALARRS